MVSRIDMRHVVACGAILFASACAHTVKGYFEDHDYRYPVHIDRDERVPEVGSAEGIDFGVRHPCFEDLGRAGFLRQAVAGLQEAEVRRVAARYCPKAEAVALKDPFVVVRKDGVVIESGQRGKPTAYLAMRMECFGTGNPAPGIGVDEARGGGGMGMRLEHVEQALDAWGVQVYAKKSYWSKWNIALFRVSNGGAKFADFVKHYDAGVYLASTLILEYVDVLVLAQCGQRRAVR